MSAFKPFQRVRLLPAASALLLLAHGAQLLAQETGGEANKRAMDGLTMLGCGFVTLFVVAGIALNIALLFWVARDAKARGMDNNVLWMLLVLFTGIIGLIVYLLVRPSGALLPCVHCTKKKLPILVQCPNCGYRTQ